MPNTFALKGLLYTIMEQTTIKFISYSIKHINNKKNIKINESKNNE